MTQVHPEFSGGAGFQAPRRDLALSYRDEHHPRLLGDDGKLHKFPLMSSPKTLAKLGVGVSLYFQTVRFLAVIFFVMFIISLPSMLMMVFSASSSLQTTETVTEKLKIITLSSLLTSNASAASIGSVSVGCTATRCKLCPTSKTCVETSKETIATVMSALDCLYTVVFLLSIYIFSRIQNKRVQEIDETTTTCADYTIMVTGIPKDIESPSELVDYFNKFGTVVGVSIGRSDGPLIQLSRARAEVVRRRERLQAEISRGKNKAPALEICNKKIEKFDERITAMTTGTTKLRSHMAFVTFNEGSSAVACLREFKKYSIFGPPAHMRFRHKYKMHVEKAPEPSDIQWENLEHGAANRFIRRVLSAFLAFLMLTISVVIVVAAKSFKEQQSQGNEVCATASAQAQCFLPLQNNLAPADYQSLVTRIESLPSNSTMCARCICLDLLTSNPELYTQSVDFSLVRWKAQYGKGGFCSEEAKSLLTFYSLNILAIIVVVGINVSAKYLVRILAKFEKHHILSRQEATTAVGIFVIQFCNTGLIVLLVNADIEKIKSKISTAFSSGDSAVNTATRLFPIFSGLYKDFDVSWYAVVGTALMVTIMLNVVIPIIPVLLAPFQLCWRRISMGKHSTQRDMNEGMIGPTFEIAARYGLLLSTVFVCLMYSSGMPLMLLLASFTFIVMYWVEKILLLRVYRNPPQYNDSMDSQVRKVLPWASLLHLPVAIWVFSQQDFPRPALSSAVTDFSDKLLAGVDPGSSEADFLKTYNVVARVLNWVVFPLLVLLILVILILVIPKLFFFIPRCHSRKLEDENVSNFREASRTIVGVKTYRMIDNPIYADIIMSDKSVWLEEKFISAV